MSDSPAERTTGKTVKLQFDKDAPYKAGQKYRLSFQRSQLRLRLRDDAEQPVAGARYRLTVGEKVIEGPTDEEGLLSHRVPQEATSAELRIWLEDHAGPGEPGERSRDYKVVLK